MRRSAPKMQGITPGSPNLLFFNVDIACRGIFTLLETNNVILSAVDRLRKQTIHGVGAPGTPVVDVLG
jgi:hypothetical protein